MSWKKMFDVDLDYVLYEKTFDDKNYHLQIFKDPKINSLIGIIITVESGSNFWSKVQVIKIPHISCIADLSYNDLKNINKICKKHVKSLSRNL